LTDETEVLPDPEAVALYAATWLTARAEAAQRFTIALSGGSTPKQLYQLLAKAPFRDRFPWARTRLFFGDERFVPPDHPDSNYRMANEAMIAHVPIPPGQVHRWPTDGDPAEAAKDYARTLQGHYGASRLDPGRPVFDVQLLGLGEDGHTASLFPGVAALQERDAWTAAVIGAKPEPRLTLTYPALNSSAEAVFLVAGDGKRAILARARQHDPALPASHVAPAGRVHWFVDAAAAG